MLQIDRLSQVVEEDRQSRQNIREKVIKELEASNLNEIFNKGVIVITDWLKAPNSYEGKAIRKMHLNSIPVNEIVSEMFITLCIHNKMQPIQSVASAIAVHLEYEDEWQGIRTAAELLGVCGDIGLYDVHLPQKNSGTSMMIEPLIQLDSNAKNFINKTKYLNPLVCKPDNWRNNNQGGYLTICNHVVLGKENRHCKPQALDTLNIQQNIEWELDPYIIQFTEEANKPLNTREKREAFKLLSNGSDATYEEMFNQGNSFYFCHNYDFRGRMYMAGYYINHQSTSYKKASLNFAKRQLIK